MAQFAGSVGRFTTIPAIAAVSPPDVPRHVGPRERHSSSTPGARRAGVDGPRPEDAMKGKLNLLLEKLQVNEH